jgi:hypothetical protein
VGKGSLRRVDRCFGIAVLKLHRQQLRGWSRVGAVDGGPCPQRFHLTLAVGESGQRVSEAVDQKFLSGNPVSKIKLPATAQKPFRPVLKKLEWLIQLIDGLTDVRDRAIFLVGTFCALRTSEVFGLSWKSFYHVPKGESYFMVEQVAYDVSVRSSHPLPAESVQ